MRWRTWRATISGADFEFPIRRAGARRRSNAALAASWDASAATKDAKNQGTQPRLFRIVSAARRTVLVPQERARSVSGAEPRSLRCAGDVAEKHGDGICGTCDKTGGADAHRAAKLRVAPGADIPVRIARAEFRLLVRAAEQRRVPDGYADRRKPDPAGAALRTIRHGDPDVRNTDRRRALRLHSPAPGNRSREGSRAAAGVRFSQASPALSAPQDAGHPRRGVPGEGRRGNRAIAGAKPGPCVLPVHQLFADE